jgi:hypothetical protein
LLRIKKSDEDACRHGYLRRKNIHQDGNESVVSDLQRISEATSEQRRSFLELRLAARPRRQQASARGHRQAHESILVGKIFEKFVIIFSGFVLSHSIALWIHQVGY